MLFGKQPENMAFSGQSDESSINFPSFIRWEFQFVVKLAWELWVFIYHCDVGENYVLTFVYKGLWHRIACLEYVKNEVVKCLWNWEANKPFQPHCRSGGSLNTLSLSLFHGNYVADISIAHLACRYAVKYFPNNNHYYSCKLLA